MSNYSKTTDFEVKDGLASGNPAKVVKGTELETEFDAIATAVNSKADAASPTLTGTGTFVNLTSSGILKTDDIQETTTAHGVEIDGLLIKDAGIPEAAVTAHQAALSITESQISDLGTYLLVADIDDTAVNGVTNAPISSNWAYDHENGADPHTGIYEPADAAIVKSDEAETISSTWTFSGATTFSGSITLNGEVVEQDAAHSQSAGTLTLDPTNGLIQRITLTQNVTTVTDNLADGEYISLHILDGASTYTITWPTAWKWAGGSTPTLDATDMNVIEVWRANSQTYAALVGVMSSA